MNREELLEKLKAEGPISKEDLFAYFNVKNIEGLEAALYEKSKDLKVNLEYINSSFVILFELHKREFFNPVEERFYYFSLLLPGLYDFLPEDINLIGRSLGAFEAIMMLDRVFEDRNEIKYYEKLYQKYLTNKNNVALLLDKHLENISKFLVEKLQNIKMEDLEKLGKNVLGELDKITKDRIS
jgi:hypothetical protein